MEFAPIKIREAVLSDLDAILDLHHLLLEQEGPFDFTLDLDWTYSKQGRDYFKSRIDEARNACLVAECGDRLVGYVAGAVLDGKMYRSIPSVAELENMYVVKEFRRHGVGTKLADRFVSWCQDHGARIYRVEVCASNSKAVEFYRSLKFGDYNIVLQRVEEVLEKAVGSE